MNRLRHEYANIWVISDTHLKSEKNLPASFVNRLGREDLIIHLGDFTSLGVVRFLESSSKLVAVCGNCDSRNLRELFPARRIIDICGFKIAMTHGRGSPSEAIGRVKEDFENKVDIALFGHTHSACHFRSGNTLFFNPGSPTDGRGNGETFGLLHLDSDPWAEVLEIESFKPIDTI